MTRKELICIVCPNGCQLKVDIEGEGKERRVTEVTGQLCDKGPPWAEQEVINPTRTISSSMLVENGNFALVSVKTDVSIPRDRIMDVMKAIKETRVRAPVNIGDRIIEGPAGTDCNIIATRNVKAVA
jgi:CxxC motif-containing protein